MKMHGPLLSSEGRAFHLFRLLVNDGSLDSKTSAVCLDGFAAALAGRLFVLFEKCLVCRGGLNARIVLK